MKHLAGKQDGASAGAEDRLDCAQNSSERLEEVLLLEELEHGGGFAAGQNQAIKISQVVRFAHLDGVGARIGECRGVCGVVALNRQDADRGTCSLIQFRTP